MWLRVNKAKRNTASTIKWFCKVWQNMKMHERFVISLFFLLDFAMIAMGVFVQFNHPHPFAVRFQRANVSVGALNGNVLRERPSPSYNGPTGWQATIFRGGTL